MNTQIWGPPMWRILHGTSHLGNEAPKALATIVQELAFVMPCLYCRKSYQEFTQSMDMDKLPEIIASGEYSRWLYDLHNKVVAKLKRQHLTDANIPADKQEVFIESSKLQYEVLRKRLMACMPYFSQEDVLQVLGIFAYATKTVGDAERRAHFLTFTRAICELVQHVYVHKPLVDKVCSAMASVTVENFETAILPALLSIELERLPSETDITDFCSVMELAKAGSCSRGMCV